MEKNNNLVKVKYYKLTLKENQTYVDDVKPELIFQGVVENAKPFIYVDCLNHGMNKLVFNFTRLDDENKSLSFKDQICINRSDIAYYASVDLGVIADRFNAILEEGVATKRGMRRIKEIVIVRTYNLKNSKKEGTESCLQQNVIDIYALTENSGNVPESFLTFKTMLTTISGEYAYIYLSTEPKNGREFGIATPEGFQFDYSNYASDKYKTENENVVHLEPKPDDDNVSEETSNIEDKIYILRKLKKDISFIDKLTSRAEYFCKKSDIKKMLKRHPSVDYEELDSMGVTTMLPYAIAKIHSAIEDNIDKLNRLEVFDTGVMLEPEDRGVDANRFWHIYQWAWNVTYLIEDYTNGNNHSIKTFSKKVCQRMPISQYAIAALKSKLNELKGKK